MVVGLFDAALERHDEEVLGRSIGPREAPGAGIAEIRTLLEFYTRGSEGGTVSFSR